eukprot:1525720-Rhodomonas_salina.1
MRGPGPRCALPVLSPRAASTKTPRPARHSIRTTAINSKSQSDGYSKPGSVSGAASFCTALETPGQQRRASGVRLEDSA